MESIVYIVIVGKPREIEDVQRKQYFIFTGAVALSLIFSSLISIYLSPGHGHTLVHVINLLLTGSFLFLSVIESVLIIAPSFLYLQFTFLNGQQTLLIKEVAWINIMAVMIFAIVIAKMTLQSKLSNLIYQQEIQNQSILHQQLANLDGLTKIYNRRFFEEELKRLDTERNLPLTLVMADLNGLKLINDAFGHLLGDNLLGKAAEIMKKECRATDIIARIGGDEFVIILPKTNSDHAAMIVKRIKDVIANEKVNVVMLSISFGWETKQEPGEDVLAVFTASRICPGAS